MVNPPLLHLVICNLKAPPPPPLPAPSRPNSGSPSCSRGRQESGWKWANKAELYVFSTLCICGVVHSLSPDCLSSIHSSFMFQACSLFCEPTPFLDAQPNQSNISHDLSISSECGLLGMWQSQLGGFVDQKKPPRDHKRDIVQNRPYSSFVDKWIFMLINRDTVMSENCGECGFILAPEP